MSDMILWGFDGSTYVRTVKMVLAEKGFTQFKQVPLNVLQGDPKTPEHLERHPFGKVPVLDHDGARILETSAIARYLNDVLPGKSLIPTTPKDRARMDMMVGVIDSYGYGALTGGVAAYHLFPDFVGGKNDAMRERGIENGRKVIDLAMKTKGSSPFIAGDLSLADLYLAPITFYVSLTPDKDAVFSGNGFEDWWTKIQALPSYRQTMPKSRIERRKFPSGRSLLVGRMSSASPERRMTSALRAAVTAAEYPPRPGADAPSRRVPVPASRGRSPDIPGRNSR